MENQEIHYIEESQPWTCPITGRWKVIAVGGGASGGYYLKSTDARIPVLPVAGTATSFGTAVSADGGISVQEVSVSGENGSTISGYGGYDGFTYGGIPTVCVSNKDSHTFFAVTGNATIPAACSYSIPTPALGYGAGGGVCTKGQNYFAIPGRAGSLKTTIVTIDEGETIPCTIGRGGAAAEPENSTNVLVANGADGVIILQYLGV